MEVGENTLYQQLLKLSDVKSEDSLDQLLTALWQSRKTGLRDKSRFQSLLQLPSLSDLDLVLACLRSLIRKCAYDSGFTVDDIAKLLPHDLPLELHRTLLLLFNKYHTLWRDDVSSERRSLPRTSPSYHERTSTTPTLTSLPFSNMSAVLWPRQDDPNLIAQLNQNNISSSLPVMAPLSDFCPLENMGMLPRLKSMNWTMENCSSELTKRVAVITLKLQDYTKSSSGETEVKFQLTSDTLEAMLRSMTYINEQLSGTDGLEPIQKKQKQSDNSA